MTYKTLHDIKARVTARWNHPRCKFKCGQFAEVDPSVLPRQYLKMSGGIGDGHSYVSKKKQSRVGQLGKVIAVSCLPDGHIRNNSFDRGHTAIRMFTRYYIQFRDGEILGYDSHHLNPALNYRK